MEREEEEAEEEGEGRLGMRTRGTERAHSEGGVGWTLCETGTSLEEAAWERARYLGMLPRRSGRRHRHHRNCDRRHYWQT